MAKNTSGNEKKDTTSMDVGRPFTPAMFEVVLRNFTPDVPSGISGRPRHVSFPSYCYSSMTSLPLM